MIQCTSAQANKILKKLNEKLNLILLREEQSKEFLAAMGEDPESVRPQYSFRETAGEIDSLESKIRVLKHTINVFNAATEIAPLGMTIDQVLIYIPQLKKRCDKLLSMLGKLPKAREEASGYGRGSAIIDYRYLNYDLAQVEADYNECKKKLDFAQLQLDAANTTLTMDLADLFAEYQ